MNHSKCFSLVQVFLQKEFGLIIGKYFPEGREKDDAKMSDKKILLQQIQFNKYLFLFHSKPQGERGEFSNFFISERIYLI